MLRSDCPGTNVSCKEIMTFYCKLIAVIRIANYATCNIMAFLYGKDQGGNKFTSKLV